MRGEADLRNQPVVLMHPKLPVKSDWKIMKVRGGELGKQDEAEAHRAGEMVICSILH